MIEIFLGANGEDLRSEVVAIVNNAGGRLSYVERGSDSLQKGMCLTFEFETLKNAEKAMVLMTEKGLHAEGPSEY